jgi:prevent-host-death family protein
MAREARVPEIGVRELKSRASEILRHVRDERTRYTVTYRGRPVGVLLPVADAPAQQSADEAAWDNLVRLGEAVADGWPPSVSSGEVLSEMRR